VVALVNMGATFTNLTLLVRGRAVFWRDMAWGGSRYAEKLMEDWGLDRGAAENLLQGVPVEGSDPEDIQPSIHAVSDAFADELLRTVEFIRTSFKVEGVDRILLAGGGAQAPGLPEILADRLHTRVERFNPFEGLEVDPRTEDPAAVAALGGVASVVLGLALRREGDR
jgi:type IV pilus assembly protein PilM